MDPWLATSGGAPAHLLGSRCTPDRAEGDP
jgi:hypothetical protein